MNKQNTVVIGIGGMGGNTINNLVGANNLDATFLAIHTNAKALDNALTKHAIQLGEEITKGLGCSGNPEIGRASAVESRWDITDFIEPYSNVIFVAGLGGGTGSGAIPVLAAEATASGKNVVCIVSMPFEFEGKERDIVAREALKELDQADVQKHVLNNQDLFKLANEKTTFADAFRMADDAISTLIKKMAADNFDKTQTYEPLLEVASK